MVSNTSELLPEPETPVNTVSRRFGISTLTSLRLFSRAPCTRIRSWRSAARSAGDRVSVLGAVLILSPSVTRGRLRGWHPLLSHLRAPPHHDYDETQRESVTDEGRRRGRRGPRRLTSGRAGPPG